METYPRYRSCGISDYAFILYIPYFMLFYRSIAYEATTSSVYTRGQSMSLFRRLLSHRLKSSTVDDLFVFTCAAFGSLAEVQGRGSGHSSGNRPGITWSRYHGRENGTAPRNQSNRAKKPLYSLSW